MAKKEKVNVLERLIGEISANMDSLTTEMESCLTNASAARRARKLTSELGKQFKEFRAESVAYFKK